MSKKTPLFKWHAGHGGNIVSFGDYQMPLWYEAGVKKEHLSAITSAGLFDTSHMAAVIVKGTGSFELLQRCFTRDLNACIGKEKSPIVSGRCVYGAFLNENGGVIDDAIIYQITPDEYIAVVNAGMGNVVAGHLDAHKEDASITITDLTDKLGKIDIQGPMSPKILSKILNNPETVFDNIAYFSFKGHFDSTSLQSQQVKLLDGTPVLLSRSGYTGEIGFEIFVLPESTLKVWEMLMDAGEAFGITPCGLASRDSLRSGAVLPLSHQDIGEWPYLNHPWEFALPQRDQENSFSKNFLGMDALLKIESPVFTLPFVGNDPRKVSTEHAVVMDDKGNKIGTILTCTTDMAIGKHNGRIYSIASPDKPEGFTPRGLSCGFLKTTIALNSGQSVVLKEGKRTIPVTIVSDIRPDRTARKKLNDFI
ncbi:MAG: aminomethyltransferase family protein [Desulfobacterales bacterium]|nr:aminomethyltransferase family protein [Desulfobacterales bacterium]